MKTLIQFFDRLMQRWTPDPFAIAILMTALTAILALTLTPSHADGVVLAWGDSWTNMAQPFWSIPLLALAGLGARDILGFTLAILAVSGIYLSALFLIFT